MERRHGWKLNSEKKFTGVQKEDTSYQKSGYCVESKVRMGIYFQVLKLLLWNTQVLHFCFNASI